MERCKYVLTDQIGDKYCGNDKCPYCSDWCEIHEENCKYKEFKEAAMACKGGKKKGGKKGK